MNNTHAQHSQFRLIGCRRKYGWKQDFFQHVKCNKRSGKNGQISFKREQKNLDHIHCMSLIFLHKCKYVEDIEWDLVRGICIYNIYSSVYVQKTKTQFGRLVRFIHSLSHTPVWNEVHCLISKCHTRQIWPISFNSTVLIFVWTSSQAQNNTVSWGPIHAHYSKCLVSLLIYSIKEKPNQIDEKTETSTLHIIHTRSISLG